MLIRVIWKSATTLCMNYTWNDRAVTNLSLPDVTVYSFFIIIVTFIITKTLTLLLRGFEN